MGVPVSELMPCPWDNVRPDIQTAAFKGLTCAAITCPICHTRKEALASGPDGEARAIERVTAAWNTRHPTAADGVTAPDLDRITEVFARALVEQERRGKPVQEPTPEELAEVIKLIREPMRAALAAAMGVRG